MKLLLTKPEDRVKNKEGSLRISIQPIRLNIDQDALFFVKQFFTELSDENPEKISNPIPDSVYFYSFQCFTSNCLLNGGVHFSVVCCT